MATPEERHIRKTELWERDERNNALVQRKAGDAMTAVDNLAVKLASTIEKGMKEVAKEKGKLAAESQASFAKCSIELAGVIEKAAKRLADLTNDKAIAIDSYIEAFRKASEEAIEANIFNRLDAYQKVGKQIYNSTEQYKKDTAAQMSKYQVESFARYTELKAMMKLLEKKIDKIKSV